MSLDDYVFTFNRYLRERFGERVARVSFDTGLPCPWGRCVFCDNRVFVPRGAVVPGRRGWKECFVQQRKKMVQRYGAHRVLAYFQSGTSTAGDRERLAKIYRLAAKQEQVVGLIVSTRPDYVDEDIVGIVRAAAPRDDFDLWIELGLQSVHEQSLRWLNRGHDAAAYRRAVETVAKAGEGRVKVAAHLIFGIPGETPAMVKETVAFAVAHPVVQGIKIHHLQVYHGTPLAEEYAREPFPLPREEEHLALVAAVIRDLPPRVVVMRFFAEAPDAYLVAPKWISERQELFRILEEYCETHKIRQGDTAERL